MNKKFTQLITMLCKSSQKKPWLWFLAAVILSLPAITQFSKIGLDTDLIRLLPENSTAYRMKKKMDQLITGSGGFFTVLLESEDKEKLNLAFESVISELKDLQEVDSLEYQHPVDFYKKYRYCLAPSESLERILDFFIRLEARVNPMGEDLLGEEESQKDKDKKEENDKKEIKKMMRYLDLPKYHQSENGNIRAVKIFPKKGITSLGKIKKIYIHLSQITEKIAGKYNIWMGIGGSLRNNIDQYDFIIADLGRSGTITLLTVLLALIIGFRSIRILPVVLFPLLLGLIWTLGAIPALVGDLNTITSFLLLVSFGLGIDFSIHLVKRFQLEFRSNPLNDALINTFQMTGKSIVVSGLTTALALFILAFSAFRGFSEFGIIGGFSLIMILLAMILFLPALLVLGVKVNLIKKDKGHRNVNRKVPIPLTTIVLLMAVFVSLIWGGLGLRFNYDFSKMEIRAPQEKEVKDRFYQVYESMRSPAALFIAKGENNLNKLIKVLDKRKKEKASRIQRFLSIRQFCPGEDEFQNRLIWIDEIKDVINGRWIERVEDEDYKKWIKDMRIWIPPDHPPKIDELPKNVRNRFMSKNNAAYYIVPVYIKGEKQKGKNAMTFSKELFNLNLSEKINIIGPFGETTVLADVLEIVTQEGPWLVLITFLGIFLLIWINQKSLQQTLWVVMPLITGMVLTIGIMVMLGMTLNFFNVVVFPTLIGMGVDDGVHYYRRWRECGKKTEETQTELFGPLTLTSVTTMFGYVGIAFSNHPGLQSIGILACIGLFCTWLTSLFLLPGLLNLISLFRNSK